MSDAPRKFKAGDIVVLGSRNTRVYRVTGDHGMRNLGGPDTPQKFEPEYALRDTVDLNHSTVGGESEMRLVSHPKTGTLEFSDGVEAQRLAMAFADFFVPPNARVAIMADGYEIMIKHVHFDHERNVIVLW